jgi:arginyl-tRNA synthetase
MNFLGDWGKHIGTLAVGWERFGSDESFASDPVRHLLEVFTKITAQSKAEQDELKKVEGQEKGAKVDKGQIDADKDAFFKKMEDGDENAQELWKRFRETCIADYRRLYSRMGIKFDDYSGESTVSQDSIAEVENALKQKGVSEDSKGASVVDFASHQHPGLGIGILRFQEGTTSYLLRDIAAALQRYQQHQFDRMVYVVSAKQVSHFKQVITALELMGRGDLAEKLEHVSFEKTKGIKARPGNPGLLLGDILDDAQAAVRSYTQGSAGHGQSSAAAYDQDQEPSATEANGSVDTHGIEKASWNPRTAEPGALALSAQILSARRGTTYPYEPKKLASKETHSALYLQTCLAVIERELAQGDFWPIESPDSSTSISAFLSDPATDYSLFIEEAYMDILRHLVHFPSAVATAQKTLESSGLLAYLYILADCVSGMLKAESEDDTQETESSVYEVPLQDSAAAEHVGQGDKEGPAQTAPAPLTDRATAPDATTANEPTKDDGPGITKPTPDHKAGIMRAEASGDANGTDDPLGSIALPHRRHDSVLDITDDGLSSPLDKVPVNALDEPTPQNGEDKTDSSTRPALRLVFLMAVRYVLVSGLEILGLDLVQAGRSEGGATVAA